MTDPAWFIHRIKGALYGEGRRLTVTNVAGRQLEPKRIKEHRIGNIDTSNHRTRKILQLGDEEKTIDGEVELLHTSLTINLRLHPEIKFNGVSAGHLDISQYSHPRRKEFWYGDYNNYRAPFAEMLKECCHRKIQIIFPGIVHFTPSVFITSNNVRVDAGVIYCDLPTAAEVKREYPGYRL